MPNRRTFLKQLGAVVGIMATVPAIETISDITVANKFELGPQQRMIFRRMVDKRWIFEFVDTELFNPAYKDQLVVGVHNKAYILDKITDIQISTEYKYGWHGGVSEADYIHWFSGDEWREV